MAWPVWKPQRARPFIFLQPEFQRILIGLFSSKADEFSKSCLIPEQFMKNISFVLRRWSFLCGVVLLLGLFSQVAHASGRKVLLRVKPVYPPIAKRMKVTGSVLLTVTVEANGRVKSADAVMGEHLLIEAARVAVEKWKFEPAESQTFEDVELQFPADAE